MEISRGRMFKTLYKKDVLLGKNESLLIMGFIVVANLFLYYKAQTSWSTDVSLVLSMFLLWFIPLTLFFKSFTTISSEWKENTVYLMMSLPVSGNMIFLSKILALLTQGVILALVAVPFTGVLFIKWGFNINELREVIALIDKNMIIEMLKFFTIVFSGFTLGLVTAFFSTVVGRMFKKYSGLITFVIFLVVNFIMGKVTAYFLDFAQFGTRIIGMEIQFINNVDFLLITGITIALTVVMFFATTAIYDKKVEL